MNSIFAQFAYKDDDDNTETQKPDKRDNDERFQCNDIIEMYKKRKVGFESLLEPKGLGEIYHTPGVSEKRLKLIIVGHNPSNQSWLKGHYYANPSNRMWFLLRKANLVPSHFDCTNDVDCPAACGIGFTDVMTGICETDCSEFSDRYVSSFKTSFYSRLVDHVKRVKECDSDSDAYPHIIAFAGVRQWKLLFSKHSLNKVSTAALRFEQLCKFELNDHNSTNSSYGIQHSLPSDWPQQLDHSLVFTLPSSSGAAAMTNEQRETPYRKLGYLFSKIS